MSFEQFPSVQTRMAEIVPVDALYSQYSDGVYWRACVLFSPYQVGGQKLGRFVLDPFQYWTKTAHTATLHCKTGYHRSAMAIMTEFLVGNLNVLLTLALTLPITSCRSFSQLKLIKTARRATMSESRLGSIVTDATSFCLEKI